MKERKHLRDIRIKVFNAGWWFYVILTILFLWAVSFFSSFLSVKDRLKMILILSIIEYIVLRFYKYSLKDIRDDYNYYNELPCYLCNQSTIMCIIAALTENQILMGYCFTVGTFGALLAVFMPDRYNRDQLLFSKQAFGFYGYHGLLIVTCLAFYTTGVYQTRSADALWAMAITFSLAAIAHIINFFLRKTGLNQKANYIFTYEPDNAILDMLYRIFPVKLLYMIPIMLAFGLAGFVLLSVL